MLVQRMRDYGMLSPKQDIYSTSSPPKTQKSYWKKGGKIVGARGGGELQVTSVWGIPQSSCTYELRAIITARSRPVRARVSQNPNMEGSGGCEASPRAKKLSAIDSFLEKESQFS